MFDGLPNEPVEPVLNCVSAQNFYELDLSY